MQNCTKVSNIFVNFLEVQNIQFSLHEQKISKVKKAKTKVQQGFQLEHYGFQLEILYL